MRKAIKMTHPTTVTASTGGPDSHYRLNRGTLVSAAIAIGVAQLGLSIPAVLNGLFQQDIAPTSAQLTWISDAFLVPVTIFELTFGVIGDLFGRKRLLVGGSVLFSLGMLVGFFSPGAGTPTDTRVLVLWIGQILAGIGAAAIMPTTLAMVAAGTHTPRDRARSISIWAATLATGSFVSPVLGGYLAGFTFNGSATASWRWAFLAVVVLALGSALVTLLFAKTSSAPIGRSLDWPGQITIAIALFGLLYAIIQGSSSGWGSPDVIGGFVISAIFFVVFIVVEHRSTAPLLRLDLFKNRAFAIAAIATVFGMFAFLGTAYSTSIRMASIQGFSPLKTSIAFVLLNGATLLLAPLIARIMPRVNPKWTMGIGFALFAVGDIWMSLIPASNLSVAAVVTPVLLVGIGFAFAISSLTGVAVNTVPNPLAGMASGATSLLRDFGFTLGPAVIGSIALSRAASEIQAKVGSTPALKKALDAFNAAPGHATAAQKPALEAAVGAVNSGPLGANGVPATVTLPTGQTVPFNPLHEVAFNALSSAYSLGYLVCGLAALLAAILVIVGLSGGASDIHVSEESLAD
jgi:MFS family permease